MPEDGHCLAILTFDIIPPLNAIGSSAAKMKFPKAKLRLLTELKFQAKMAFFQRNFCHTVLDSHEQQAIPPD